MMRLKVYPAAEVAYVLRRELGPMRAWEDALADMRRGKTSVDGHVLLPFCQIHDGRTWRPAYSAVDVRTFIEAVRSDRPAEAKRNEPPAYKAGGLEAADLLLAWHHRKLLPFSARPGAPAHPLVSVV